MDAFCSKEGAESEGEAFDLPVNLCSNSHLWLHAVGSGRKKNVADTSGQNRFPLQGGRA